MGVKFDKWTLLKIFEVAFATACLITKRVTDDEAARLFLYLQKLSREWSLLNNITWDRIGSAVADATYGGYVIITSALLIGRLVGELPTQKRITEMVLLGLGALLFVVLGSLEFAALDSVPPDLVDNAAILGTLSLTTAALFLLDLAGPRAKKPSAIPQSSQPRSITRALEIHKMKSTREPFSLEPEFTRIEEARMENERNGRMTGEQGNGVGHRQNGQAKNGKKKEKKPKRFDIYGKDVGNGDDDKQRVSEETMQTAEEHSPVWSKIQQGQYGKYDVVAPHFLFPPHRGGVDDVDNGGKLTPSSPGDPGYVQYTAKKWEQPTATTKTPRQSPTQV